MRRPPPSPVLVPSRDIRAVLDGLDDAPFDALPASAGLFAGMRPAFVVGVLAPLAVVVLATWWVG